METCETDVSDGDVICRFSQDVFVWFFYTVRFQMCPQSTCITACIFALLEGRDGWKSVRQSQMKMSIEDSHRMYPDNMYIKGIVPPFIAQISNCLDSNMF